MGERPISGPFVQKESPTNSLDAVDENLPQTIYLFIYLILFWVVLGFEPSAL